MNPDHNARARWVPALLALLSFHVGTWLVGLAVPADDRGDIAAARRRFREQLNEVELVVIGSSRIQEGLDVEALEAELRQSGEDLRAFNFGAGGMRTLEQGHVLRWVLAQRPPRLKWVILEAWPLGITLRKNTDYSPKAEVLTARAISWHTTQVTWRAVAAIWRFPLPAAERLGMASHHVEAWARHVWNLGLLSERLFDGGEAQRQRRRWTAGRPSAPEPAEAEDTEQELVLRGKRGGRMTEMTTEQYEDRVDQVQIQNQMPVDLCRLDLALLAERARAARVAGVELIYLTMPGEVGSPEILRLHEAGLLGPLLHFNDPERYPELFAMELRKTPAHLNSAGAQVFSRLLAREFLELRAQE